MLNSTSQTSLGSTFLFPPLQKEDRLRIRDLIKTTIPAAEWPRRLPSAFVPCGPGVPDSHLQDIGA